MDLVMDRPVRLRRRRKWPYIVPFFALIVLAFAWSALWLRASNVTQETLQGWFDREARTGRLYSCVAPRISGFPFRIEVHCGSAAMEWRSTEPTVFLETAGMTVAAQVWQPSLLTSEFVAPLSINDGLGRQTFNANWTLLQSSVRGVPASPERASIVIENPEFERVRQSGSEKLFNAKHAELHGRIVEGSATGNPVIRLVLKLDDATAPTINPLTAKPFDATITFDLRGLKDFSPKPWPDRFREIQSAGGRIDISHARAQQGESVALATGSLAINDNGHLDGQLLITVAGLDRLLPTLGLDKLVAPGGRADRVASTLERLSPGLGNIAREHAGAGIAAGIGLLGEQTQLEGRRAVILPLRINNGEMFLGQLSVGQVNPMF
jgi:hypothetical protein